MPRYIDAEALVGRMRLIVMPDEERTAIIRTFCKTRANE